MQLISDVIFIVIKISESTNKVKKLGQSQKSSENEKRIKIQRIKIQQSKDNTIMILN